MGFTSTNLQLIQVISQILSQQISHKLSSPTLKLSSTAPSPVELRFKQGQLPGDLDRMKGHEVKQIHLSGSADVPLDGRRQALEGDVVTHAVRLRRQFPLDDLIDGLDPLSHGFAYKRKQKCPSYMNFMSHV